MVYNKYVSDFLEILISTGEIMEHYYIYVVSDSIGETAEVVVKAVLSQFDRELLKLKRFHRVDNEGKICQIVNEAAADNAGIFYTLAAPELKTRMRDEVEKSGYDLVLYTCTYGGKTRVTVFCDRTDSEQ